MFLQRVACAVDGGLMATPPRKIDKGMFFYVTVRAMHRRYRFVPKRRIYRAIRFCFTAVLDKYRNEGKIELYEFVFMSNHYHLLGRDLVGCLPKFVQEFNALLSAELNALRGTSDSNFSRKPYGLVQVHGNARLVEHAVYTLANPISAFLVARAKHWPGLSSLKLEYGDSVVVDKPRGGLWSGRAAHVGRRGSQRSKRAAFADRSVLPDHATLTLDRPPVMLHLSDSELRQHIRDRLAERERELDAERTRRGIRVVGRRRVLNTHHDDMPKSEELFARNPTFSAETAEQRAYFAAAYKAFVSAYRLARDAYYFAKVGLRNKIVFPPGTYRLRVLDRVACADP